MKTFELTFSRTHQFFSIVINFHRWTWIDEPGHSYRTDEKCYVVIFCLNIFYHEVRFVFVPYKKIIKI